jgi:hypothetical protein
VRPSQASTTPTPKETAEKIGEITVAKEFAIDNLTKKLGIKFEREVHVENIYGLSYVFDAVGFDGNNMHAVEVKFSSGEPSELSKFVGLIYNAHTIEKVLTE